MKKTNIFLILVMGVSLFVFLNETKISAQNKNVYTRYSMSRMFKDTNNNKYKIPNSDPNTIKNIPTALNDEGTQMNVWDSWPLQNKNGSVKNYHGYNVVFAMAGNYKIYVFYKKANQKVSSVNDWKFAGRAFEDSDKIRSNGEIKNQGNYQEWSGSAIPKSSNYISLFYTAVQKNGSEAIQNLSTANINIKANGKGLYINHKGLKNNKTIFDGGNGDYYQNNLMYKNNQNVDAKGGGQDDLCLRDPKYFEYRGKKYLLFEGNTGYKTEYQGIRNIYTDTYFGGSKQFRKKDRESILEGPLYSDKVQFSNAAMGLIELNDNYSVKKVKKPIMTFNGVNDEMERPNIFKYKNKWYVFAISRGDKFASNSSKSINSTDGYMLGFYGDSPFSKLKPLNKNGLVLHHNVPVDKRNYTYSYYAIPSKNNIVITSFAGNFGGDFINKNYQTFAPSYTLSLNNGYSSTNKSKKLGQGELKY